MTSRHCVPCQISYTTERCPSCGEVQPFAPEGIADIPDRLIYTLDFVSIEKFTEAIESIAAQLWARTHRPAWKEQPVDSKLRRIYLAAARDAFAIIQGYFIDGSLLISAPHEGDS